MRYANCHPEEKHYSKGKCKKCYHHDINKQSNKKEWWRAHKLKTKFGITPEEYQEKLTHQNESCCLCGRNAKKFKNRLAVDHNHTTGTVRGLLCPPCNRVIGYLENAEWAENAKKYLDEWSDK